MASPASHTNQRHGRCQWLLVALVPVVAWAQAGEAGPPAQRRLVDRAVASIEGRVITLTQLEFETRVQLVSRGGTEAAFAPLDGEDLQQGLQLAIANRLATLEADRFDAYPLEPGELERALGEFRDRIGGEARLQAFLAWQEADLQDVGAVLRRNVRAARALEGRLKLKAQVSDAEVARAKVDVAAWRELPLESVRQLLMRERFEKLVQRELSAARKAVDVRVLFALVDGGTP
ncbi:MAG: hypothetical protein INH41_14035 [Myxococcaceae bacterium]|jgi:hypothetical protein|nr:hypothetical protein [Myxococcaceae bacterium]